MALLESMQLPLNSRMPEFALKDPNGILYKSNEVYGDNGLIVAFTCNHCPYAKAVWPRLIRLARYVRELGVNTVAINPNINQAYPEDSSRNMLIRSREWGLEFPYLIDEGQHTARAFQAQCTPDIYLYNADQELVYHGRFDDNWKDEAGVTREELKEAVEHMTAGFPLDEHQHPSMGCSIKWVQ